MVDQLTRTITATRPELVNDLKAILAELQPELKKNADEVMAIAARVVAKRMSEQELKETAAFFKSPAGQKYVASQPATLDEIVAVLQAWNERLSTDITTRVRAEMKKRGHDL